MLLAVSNEVVHLAGKSLTAQSKYSTLPWGRTCLKGVVGVEYLLGHVKWVMCLFCLSNMVLVIQQVVAVQSYQTDWLWRHQWPSCRRSPPWWPVKLSLTRCLEGVCPPICSLSLSLSLIFAYLVVHVGMYIHVRFDCTQILAYYGLLFFRPVELLLMIVLLRWQSQQRLVIGFITTIQGRHKVE